MITVQMSRQHGSTPLSSSARSMTTSEAFQLLALCELAYGGTIYLLTDTTINVVTSVIDCVDTTVFSGSAEEMQQLVRLAELHMLAQDQYWNDIVESAAVHITRPALANAPFLTAASAGIIHIGRYSLRLAVLLAYGISGQTAVDIADRMTIEDIVAGVALASEHNTSLLEVLQ